ncbi:MAG: histidinol-phosphate transaminase [Vallitaleaceae bacterium]|jgi:histidinol-phosphate aminotransferase|nr:histidinol-phosphate transaminase [Vallitaleaceae bacterium]
MINPRPIIETLSPYVPGKPAEDVMAEYNLKGVIKLASNENPLGCSDRAKEAVIKAMKTPSFYPDGNATKLRAKLSKRLDVNDNQLIFGSGSDELISMIAKTFISPGDHGISASLTFPQYKAAVRSMDGIYIGVPNKNFGYDLDAIASAVTEKTKLIYIANPNNPTGTMITHTEQASFVKKIPSSVIIVFDEAYNEYITDESFPDTLSMMKTYDNVILFRTFSKMYGLASLRIGYAVGNPIIIDYMNRIRNPFNVTTVAQVAAIAALEDTEFVKESYQLNEAAKLYTYQKCKELGLSYIESSCNFVFIDCRHDSQTLFVKLQEKGIIVRPIPHPDTMTYLRISLGTIKQMEKTLNVLGKLINKMEA